jgi:hypothetical protein
VSTRKKEEGRQTQRISEHQDGRKLRQKTAKAALVENNEDA